MKTPLKSSFLAIVCCVSTLMPAAGAGIPKNENPALLYWQAAAELPALTDDKAKMLRDVAGGKIEFDADLIKDLDFEQSLKFLRKAMVSEAPCEWGLAWEEGLEMRTPHLSKMREFSVIVTVLAEAEFANGETEAGIDLLIMAHHIARDAGATPMILSVVIQNVLEQRTITTAARHCLKWDVDARNDYATRLNTLPALTQLHEGFVSELVWVDGWEKDLKGDFGPALERLGFGVGEDGGQAKSRERVREMIATYRKKHAEATAILKQSGDTRRAAVTEFEKELSATRKVPKNVLTSLLMPALNGLVRGEDRTALARMMLKFALDHGPEIVAKDAEGMPFEIQRSGLALELKSDKPDFALKFAK